MSDKTDRRVSQRRGGLVWNEAYAGRRTHGYDRRKPIAAPTQPPFPNCRYTYCDLPGQCRSEGKCHHPKTVAQPPAGDTPRTDANVGQGEIYGQMVTADFARSLERELAEAKSELRLKNAYGAELKRTEQSLAAAESAMGEAEKLNGDAPHRAFSLQDRIKVMADALAALRRQVELDKIPNP